MNIVVIGTGYVGLVTGVCLAAIGNRVVCIDKDEDKIKSLKNGFIPIYEPKLQDILSTCGKKIKFKTDAISDIKKADAIFIAVGTPTKIETGMADLSHVLNAAKEISPHIKNNTIIITKSTVPVGTGNDIENIISEIRKDIKFHVVSNPEFLREGNAIFDFMKPDRIVIGSNDKSIYNKIMNIYNKLNLEKEKFILTDRNSAELIKYASNAFLAMKITYINEIADLCEASGADIRDVSKGIGSDSRIGPQFLSAGPGYGGSCFPKDTLALIKTAAMLDTPIKSIETVVEINEQRKLKMVKKISDAIGNDIVGKKITFLGLTFKPNTDDMREAPSITIINELIKTGAKIHGYDPVGNSQAEKILTNTHIHDDVYEAIKNSYAIVLMTEWSEFKKLNFKKIHKIMKNPIMIDLRNFFEKNKIEKFGLKYVSIGKS